MEEWKKWHILRDNHFLRSMIEHSKFDRLNRTYTRRIFSNSFTLQPVITWIQCLRFAKRRIISLNRRVIPLVNDGKLSAKSKIRNGCRWSQVKPLVWTNQQQKTNNEKNLLLSNREFGLGKVHSCVVGFSPSSPHYYLVRILSFCLFLANDWIKEGE